MLPLFELARPTTLDTVVGQDKAVSICKRLLANGVGGRALWFEGPSGLGKTTLARIIANVVGDGYCTREIDCQDLDVATVRKYEAESYLCTMIPDKMRVFIVNEAHGLKSKQASVRQLLVTLERIPAHAVWIFTTTLDGTLDFGEGDDSAPFLSRCLRIKLASRPGAETLAECIVDQSTAHGWVEGYSREEAIKRALKHLRDGANNMRSTYQAVEAGLLIA